MTDEPRPVFGDADAGRGSAPVTRGYVGPYRGDHGPKLAYVSHPEHVTAALARSAARDAHEAAVERELHRIQRDRKDHR